jgi:EpsI family protein
MIWRLSLVCVLLLLPPATYLIGGWSAASTVRFDLSDVPSQLGSHVVTAADEIEPDILAKIQPEVYLLQSFNAPGEEPVWVYAAFYTGYGTTGAHSPATCYPSQGWDVSRAHDREVALEVDDSLVVQQFRVTQNRTDQRVVYWFQPAIRWPQGGVAERALLVYDALRGRKEYAFVRLSTLVVEPGEESGQAAEDRLLRMTAELAPWVRDVVTSARSASETKDAPLPRISSRSGSSPLYETIGRAVARSEVSGSE